MHPQERPRVIGLLGGIASGKSFIARILEEWGAIVFDADAAGHRALAECSIKQAVRSHWGEKVFDVSGKIDRRALAEEVFATTPEAGAELKHLEDLTHPFITQKMHEALREAEQNQATAVVLDAPVLLKAGWHTQCDDVIFIEAPYHVRLARAKQRGWSEEEFSSREAAQESLGEKKQHATVLIDNSGDIDQTRRQLCEYWNDRFRVKPC